MKVVPVPMRSGPLLLVLAACAPADTAAPVITVTRDSAGITIVENVQPDAAGVPARTYEQVLDLGDAGGAGPTAFYRVAGAVRLDDGRIAVADRGSAEIRFFDETGAFVGTVGRRGGGPGEFRDIADLLHGPSDSLYVYDGAAQRVTVLSAEGAFARELALFTGAAPGALLARLPDASFLASTSGLPSKFDIELGLSRRPIQLLRVSADGGTVDTIAEFPGREIYFRVVGKGVSGSPPPFRTDTRLAVAGDVIWAGTDDAPELRAFDLDGRLVRILRTGRALRPVTDRHIEAWIARAAEDFPAQKQPLEGSSEDAVRRSLADVPLPETLPAFGQIGVARDGRVWVADFDDLLAPAPGWTVYGEGGAVVARVELPPGFRLLDAGPDWLLGTVLDDLDVEHVVLFRR